jgi:hypothetical protein
VISCTKHLEGTAPALFGIDRAEHVERQVLLIGALASKHPGGKSPAVRSFPAQEALADNALINRSVANGSATLLLTDWLVIEPASTNLDASRPSSLGKRER